MRSWTMGWAVTARDVRRIASVALVFTSALAFGPARATTDADGDGYAEGTDCDDTDETVWSVPAELQNLHFVSKTALLWDAMSPGAAPVTYVTVRSTSPSVFATTPPAACSDTEGLTASTTDPSVPAPGSAFFYLVRARNACGDGPLGQQSNGTPIAGLSCDCSALCSDGLSCTRDRCSDGACVHDPITTVISDQPEGVAVCPGESATFRVRGAPDSGGPHYQWKKNGANVGTDSPTLTLTGLGGADNNAQITVVVTGACAPTTSQTAVLTVFSSAASCAGGGNGYEAPNGASDVSRLSPSPCKSTEVCGNGIVDVSLHSGEVRLDDVDFAIAGRGFDFVWERFYRQRTGTLTSMGHNWDFSYNRRIVRMGGHLSLSGGDGRADVYDPSPTGCYTSPGFFREICPQLDGTYVLTFPNHTTWRFASFDGSPVEGRILAVQDSDANTMSFLYDSSGRLSTIMDTLGRPITVSYDPDGYVSAVSDFGGHTVTYHRYTVADPDGMPGDLASVTSPTVTGTPNGNDFPDGQTTTYTYTKSTGQPALDHNLLTVRRDFEVDGTPPDVMVRNVYTPTTNPASPAFDRVQKQVYGDDPSTSISYVYVVPAPGEEPGAVTKTIVRDRDGNIGDAYFDSGNRLVAVRQYTGQAPSHTLPTDPTTNRPGTRLRLTDPLSYRTGFSWNSESLITEISFPKLDSVQFTYDSSSTDVKLHANLLERTHLPGPAGGDQTSRHDQWVLATGYGTEPCPRGAVCGETSGRWSFPNGPRQTIPLDSSRWSFPNGPRQSTSQNDLATEVDGGVWRLDPVDFTTGDAKVWTPRSFGSVNNWNPTLDFTRRGYGVNTRSDTMLGVDRARPWVSYTDPNGRTYSQTIDPSTGHVTQRTAPPVTIGQSSGGAQFISESWTYNTHGQVVTHTDPLGHVTAATYYTSGPQQGYLESVSMELEPGEHVLTIYGVDQWGNTTSVTDPNGNTDTFVYNQLDQLVRHVSPAPLSYTTDFRYDRGGRLERVEADNRDETGAPRTRPKIFTIVGHKPPIGHDPLNRPAFMIVDGPGALDPVGGLNLRTEFSYDGNGRLTLVRRPSAVSGAQPHDVTRMLYDETGALYRRIEAEGDAVESTTQLDYDLDGALAAVREGLQSQPDVVTVIVCDGYSRPVQTTDPTGNVTTLHYDANDNLVSRRVDGELTDGESGPNVRLSESFMTYDEIGRQVQTDTAFFDSLTGAPIGDGLSTGKTFFDERSQVVHTEDDDGHGPYMTYDGAGRLTATHDAVGNTVDYEYDPNGNVLTVTTTDVSDSPVIPPQVTVTTSDYDALDRRLSTSQGGVTHSLAWDSVADFPVVTHDGRSNVIRRDHDGAGRLVATHRDMTDSGTGSGSVTFVLDATRSYDDEGRLTSQTDDNGNTTSYAYDAKGRLTVTTNPDGTSETNVYNVHDDLVSWTDPNGTVVTATFDALGRLKTRSIARAPGVLGTTSETWKHDGLSRIVYAQNNDAQVTRSYDSLSDLTRETSAIGADGGKNVNWIFTGGGNLQSVTYPSGHNMAMSHDSVGHVDEMTSTGPGVCSGGPPPHAFCTVAAECGGGPCVPMSPVTMTYDYLGDRVVRGNNGNGTWTEITYDDHKRVSRVTLRITPMDAIDDRALTWDDDSNKTSRMLLSSPGAGTRNLYSYDSASRMIHSVQQVPGQSPITIDYALDGVNNRTSVTGGPESGSYPMSSSGPEPADHQVNQYTSTPWDGARTYDRSGNMVSRSSGASTMSYDYRGRLVLVSGSSGSGSYAYDVFGRRVLADGQRLYYDGMQEIEERSPSGSLSRLMVHGVGLTESLMAGDFNFDGSPERVFHHMDDLGNVVTVTSQAAAPLERYDYGDFGRPRFLNPAGASIPQSAIGNPFLFGAHRYDASTGLYDFLTRHLDPRAGRFVSRDTIGAWGDPSALGNATVYAGNNPWSSTDPMGMSQKTRAALYEEFKNGDIPNENDFADTIDSALNLVDDGMTSYRAVLRDRNITNDPPCQRSFVLRDRNITNSTCPPAPPPSGRQFVLRDRNIANSTCAPAPPPSGRQFVLRDRNITNSTCAPAPPPSSARQFTLRDRNTTNSTCGYFLDPQNKPRQTIAVTEITRDGSTAGAAFTKLCPGHPSCPPTEPPAYVKFKEASRLAFRKAD